MIIGTVGSFHHDNRKLDSGCKVNHFPANGQKKSVKSSEWLKIWRMAYVGLDVPVSSFAFLDEPNVTLRDAERQIRRNLELSHQHFDRLLANLYHSHGA